jgi:hypothetical protein
MRAVVYGLLAAVAALVLIARPSAHGTRARPTDDYSGITAQGAGLHISMAGRRIESLRAAGIWATCEGRPRVGTTWSPAANQSNVSYSRHGSQFTVHEWPSPLYGQPPGARVNLWLHGNLNWDIHRIDGVIRYFETGARGNCASGPIQFGVSR